LTDFPQRQLADRQHLQGHGGVISFEISGGFNAATEFLRHLRLSALAEHVGGIDTLVTHPASMTHADVPQEQLASVGLTPGLLRLSVGLEDPADILEDLQTALYKVEQAGRLGSTRDTTRELQGTATCRAK
jgi:cystathionine beta-lyase/cystathionine gamma-synthase